ncbi:hypothetical protein Tco_1012313, partial [Tanacetum coccineum]
VENYKAMSSEEEPKVVRKNDDALIIGERVSDDEEEDVSQPKIKKKIVRPRDLLKSSSFVEFLLCVDADEEITLVSEESLGENASKQGRIDAIDADEEITLVSVHDEIEVDEEVVEVINTAKLIIDAAQVSVAGDKASAATTVSTATTTTATTVDDITLAQALEEMKSTKPKTKGVVIQELGESTTTKSSQLSSQQSQDKGKGIWIEPVKLMKKKDQISFDEEVDLKLQAEFDEEERLAREKAKKEQEANIALIETWDDIQAKIDADHQLDERLEKQALVDNIDDCQETLLGNKNIVPVGNMLGYRWWQGIAMGSAARGGVMHDNGMIVVGVFWVVTFSLLVTGDEAVKTRVMVLSWLLISIMGEVVSILTFVVVSVMSVLVLAVRNSALVLLMVANSCALTIVIFVDKFEFGG